MFVKSLSTVALPIMTTQYELYPAKTLLVMILVQTNFIKIILNQYFIKIRQILTDFFVNYSTHPTIFLGVYLRLAHGSSSAGQTAESETPQPTNDTA